MGQVLILVRGLVEIFIQGSWLGVRELLHPVQCTEGFGKASVDPSQVTVSFWGHISVGAAVAVPLH